MNKTITALAIMMASFAANASVLPETPVPFKSGTGAIDNDTVYIGLGSAGTAWYKLDTQAKDKKWTALAAFPGGPRDQATSAFIDGNLYVFGGIGKNSKGLTQVFNDVHKYNPKTNSWVKLMSHAPMGMAGHVTFVHNGKAYVTGGVNQNIFNGYFEDLNEAGKDSATIDKINAHYFDKKAEDYLNRSILDQGWYEMRRQLEYKQLWRGGQVLAVPPAYTSQRCACCGHTAKENRLSQSKFRCQVCGYTANADVNGARNILAAGHAVLACGEMVQSGRSLKQEPTEMIQATA
ncbi:transposase [Escherichia coli]|nr:transposase [Escherichia coli]EEX9399630.1 transposase [Escherichia coli]EEZ6946349.1 transposase [Escherichia coli]EFC0000651.1 transposase [Escherichia coli]EFH0699693.1 transposase [Escherichia coli]